MKPLRITKKEYESLDNALWEQAKLLHRRLCGDIYRWSINYYGACSFYWDTDNLKCYKKNNVENSNHFVNVPCVLGNGKGIEVICLAKKRDGKRFRYYLHTHKKGECPWRDYK